MDLGTVRDGDALLEAALPRTRVILLNSYGDPVPARHALDVGASGFVLKVFASTELVQAIRMVLGGGTYVSSAIAI